MEKKAKIINVMRNVKSLSLVEIQTNRIKELGLDDLTSLSKIEKQKFHKMTKIIYLNQFDKLSATTENRPPISIPHACSHVLIDRETGKQYDLETGEEIIKIG